ncbi:hypothetical protein SAMN04488034_11310 [Salinimicrobium catena]|uniref:Phytanoyl-CoA dioxygenase (PhyH) n=1 Tax=Salinimicrobium catena TaxID=390640 RepID=A0A1H5PDU0_9FLAO|nr:phytanoyl-CoA dioxygenase family protein [Salinimicrobium catena]SDL80862.1 hypothetical protein SAMN04488140_11310 [Salinimicrobium catena]SEF12075.1 hypothetical protein SAMN04488034_11310 [Salinimicrobium catena]
MKNFSKKIFFYGQRTIKSYGLRTSITKIQAHKKGKIKITGLSKFVDQNNESEFTNILSKDGYVELDHLLDPKDLKEIKDYSSKLPLFDPFDRKLGHFEFSTIPNKTHVANFSRQDLIKCTEIMNIANDPGILRIVQDFLGCTPTISNVNMWWSKAGKEQAKDAQLFHRDVDDLKFCKLFIYLTDVGTNDGPHTYVKGSSSTNKLTTIRRYQDSEVIEQFGEDNIISFTRPKGSCFLVDTYGFHKGTLPIENDRLLLQIQYSINPVGIENYKPVKISNNYNSYINRLLLKN